MDEEHIMYINCENNISDYVKEKERDGSDGEHMYKGFTIHNFILFWRVWKRMISTYDNLIKNENKCCVYVLLM